MNVNQEQSADNRWSRVFRLSPSVDWYPAESVNNRSVFEVLANYSSYDFDALQGAGIRSTAFRRWSAADTLRIPAIESWILETSARLDLEDRGRFDWSSFTQDVSDEWESGYYSVVIERLFWRKLLVRAGYHVEQRIEFTLEPGNNGEPGRRRTRTYRAEGPKFRFQLKNTPSFHIYVDGNLLNVKDSRREDSYRLDTIYMSMSYLW